MITLDRDPAVSTSREHGSRSRIDFLRGMNSCESWSIPARVWIRNPVTPCFARDDRMTLVMRTSTRFPVSFRVVISIFTLRMTSRRIKCSEHTFLTGRFYTIVYFSFQQDMNIYVSIRVTLSSWVYLRVNKQIQMFLFLEFTRIIKLFFWDRMNVRIVRSLINTRFVFFLFFQIGINYYHGRYLKLLYWKDESITILINENISLYRSVIVGVSVEKFCHSVCSNFCQIRGKIKSR